MDQGPKKGGRPRVFLTKDVVERRRLSKKRHNDSRRILHDMLPSERPQEGEASPSKRAKVVEVPHESYAAGADSNGKVVYASADAAAAGGSGGGEVPSRVNVSHASDGKEVDAGTNPVVGRTGGEIGCPKESRRMRNSVDQKKKQFMESNIVLDLGKQEETCGFCTAQVWAAEYTGRYVGTGPKGYSICCGKGKVQLPLLRETPPELNALITSTGTRSKIFFSKSRVYNNIFAFCSFGGNVDHSVNNGRGPYVFRVSGRTYHSLGSLVPPDGLTPKFAQLYMYDGEEAMRHRINFPGKTGELDPEIVSMLQEMLNRENFLVGIFKQLRERFLDVNPEPIRLRLFERRTTDGRLEGMPTENDYEFAALAVDNDFANHRDVVAENKKSGLQHISELHPSFMSLQYPLLFPFGEDGYRTNIKHRNVNNCDHQRNATVSMREYYAFRTQYRLFEGHTLLLGGRLFLQFVVDAWCSVERVRLQWVYRHQSIIRSDLYNNIVDSLRRGDVEATDVGRRVILPSSFTGGYRYMQQNFQDSLAVCKEYGHPDLFITFTCNPKWDEIQTAVHASGSHDSSVRPDLVARVFKMKLDAMIADFTKNSVLGRVIAALSPQTDSKTILVRVGRIWQAINKKNNMLLHTNVILIDEKGDHMLAMLRNNQKDTFLPLFKEEEVYCISNLKVVPGPNLYRSVNRDLSINFFYKTKIEHKGDNDVIPRYKFELQNFDNVKNLVGQLKCFIDVIGMVRGYGKLEKRTNGAEKMDVLLSDIRDEKIVVTLWEDRAAQFMTSLAEKQGKAHFVVITGLLAKNFSNRPSLSSTDATRTYFDIDYAPLNNLKQDVCASIGKTIEMLPPPTVTQFVTADDSCAQELPISSILEVQIPAGKDLVRCLCKGTIVEILNGNGWYYICCPKCARIVRPLDGKFYCGTCAEEANPITQRYRVVVRIEDESATTTLTLFNKEAEQLIGVPLQKLLAEMGENATMSQIPSAVKNIIGKACAFQIKITSYNITQGCEEYTVTRVSECSTSAINNDNYDSTASLKKKQKCA